MNPLYLIAAVAIGAAFAVQPAINAAAARALGSAVPAAALSVAITFAALVLLTPFFGGAPRAASFGEMPWWVIFGGLIGAAVVAGGAAIAPVTGAALFIVCMIAGQLVGSALVDHFGWFGFEERALSPLRLAGLGLVLCGVLLVRWA